MTRDELAARYKLLQSNVSDGVRTYQAMAPTGAVVMVHFLETQSAGERQTMLDMIEALPSSEQRRVLETVTVDGVPVVVTKYILDFHSLRRWLEERVERPMQAPEPASAGNAVPGEFTRLFRAAVPPSAAPEPEPLPNERPAGEFTGLFRAPEPPSPLPEPSPVRTPEPPAELKQPGEFTGLFRAAPADLPASRNDVPSPPPLARAPETSQGPIPPAYPEIIQAPPERREFAATSEMPSQTAPGGEFTGLFRASTTPPVAREEARGTAPEPALPAPRLEPPAMGLPTPPAPVWAVTPQPEQAPPAAPIVPDPGRQEQGGSFTQLFGRVEAPQPPRHQPPQPRREPPAAPPPPLFQAPPPPPFDSAPGRQPAGTDDYLGRLNAGPSKRATEMPSGPPPADLLSQRTPGAPLGPPAIPQPASFPGASSQPGEYTRVINAMSRPPVPPISAPPPIPQRAPAAQPPAQPKPSILPLVIGGAFVLVGTIALLLFFALRDAPEAGTEPGGQPAAQEAPAADTSG